MTGQHHAEGAPHRGAPDARSYYQREADQLYASPDFDRVSLEARALMAAGLAIAEKLDQLYTLVDQIAYNLSPPAGAPEPPGYGPGPEDIA